MCLGLVVIVNGAPQDLCIYVCMFECVYVCMLQEFIMNQDWNDAKSQLQQCCLTLRDASVGEPDIPVYKYVCAK